MVVKIAKHGEEPVGEEQIKNWLAAKELVLDTVRAGHGEAYAALTTSVVTYRYNDDQQEVFIRALAAYTAARATSAKRADMAHRKYGFAFGGVPDNNLDVWKDQLDPAYLTTLKSLQDVLRKKAFVVKVLGIWDALVAADHSDRTVAEWHRNFLAALEHHGFDQAAGTVDKTLTADGFLSEYVARGKLPLDPGADAGFFTGSAENYKHGGLTHTLQWLIMGAGLDAGEVPPLTGMTLAGAARRTADVRGKKPHLSPWTTLVDLNADRGLRYDATMPEGLTYWIYAAFANLSRLEDVIQAELIAALEKEEKVCVNWRPPEQ
ncbi:hypothetical protein [Actinoplanes sp. NPDC023714]|uniref:hypothetical protein n=1 Tax=Actinoplanes sp. NPDC023714 TaxID=3154322 RepID=UPI003406524D